MQNFRVSFFFAHLIWNSRFSCLTIMLVPAKNFMKTFAMKYLGNGKYSNWAVRNAFITFFYLVTFMEQFLQKRWVFDFIFYGVWLCDLNRSFKAKIISSISFLFSDVIALLLILARATSFLRKVHDFCCSSFSCSWSKILKNTF